MYKFAMLDPRPIPAAVEANEKIFASGPVLGMEVTVPALAARCELGNIDPQHSGGGATRAAIEEALTTELPPEGAVLATVRADLDAVVGMAILYLRSIGGWPLPVYRRGKQDVVDWGQIDPIDEKAATEVLQRVELVATSDKFARGGYPGPRPLPTKERPWQDKTASAESSQLLAAIAAAIADFKVPLAERVELMKRWLLTGEEPAQYRDKAEKERLDMINALETGHIKYETRSGGLIAVVESTHRAAT